ncbi:putative COF1-cofilin [Circinella umbellata]|nr:putative COF1-cofilin [Circinella umbellata]
MPTTGFTIHEDCHDQFDKLKYGKKDAPKYIIFKINDEHDQVLVDQVGMDESDGYYEQFLSCLPKEEPRYAVLDLEFVKSDDPDNLTKRKIIFYAWSPDECNVKSKMVHALNSRGFRKLFIGKSVHIQGADLSDFDLEKVIKKASSPTAED